MEDNQEVDNPVNGLATYVTQATDDYNALQCELIASRRSNDALILENNKLRVDLSEALDKLASLDTRSRQAISDLNRALEERQAQYERQVALSQREYSSKFEKLRQYTIHLLTVTRNKYQTRATVLKNSMRMQQKAEQKAREDLDQVWQSRMNEYRADISEKFENLLSSFSAIQDDKRKQKDQFLTEIHRHTSTIDRLNYENQTLKEKIDTILHTGDQFRENNSLLREKLSSKEEIVRSLQDTVKEGIEERARLKATIDELKKKIKANKNLTKESKNVKEKEVKPTSNDEDAQIDSEDKLRNENKTEKPLIESKKTVSESKIGGNHHWKNSGTKRNTRSVSKVWR